MKRKVFSVLVSVMLLVGMFNIVSAAEFHNENAIPVESANVETCGVDQVTNYLRQCTGSDLRYTLGQFNGTRLSAASSLANYTGLVTQVEIQLYQRTLFGDVKRATAYLRPGDAARTIFSNVSITKNADTWIIVNVSPFSADAYTDISYTFYVN